VDTQEFTVNNCVIEITTIGIAISPQFLLVIAKVFAVYSAN